MFLIISKAKGDDVDAATADDDDGGGGGWQ